MKSLNVHEVLELIDKKFGYEFIGKDENDHLISRKTWTKYVNDFLEVNNCSDLIEGVRRHTRYPLKFVEDVIRFNEELLKKQLCSNRKTVLNQRKIKLAETFAAISGVEVDPNVYGERIFKTQFEQMEADMFPLPSEESFQKMKDIVLQTIVDQLIDMERLNHDVYEQMTSGSLHFGLATPLEPVEDQSGNVLGFKIDATKYLKHEIIKQIE